MIKNKCYHLQRGFVDDLQYACVWRRDGHGRNTDCVNLYITSIYFLFILALETRSNYVDMLVWNFLCNPEKA